jgi:hypothetical protein
MDFFMKKIFFLSVFFLSCSLFAGPYDDRIEAFVKEYRADSDDISPQKKLSQKARQALFFLSEAFEKNLDSTDVKFKQVVSDSIKNPKITGFAAFKLFFDYAACKTPELTPDDYEGLMVARALSGGERINIGSQPVHPELVVEALYGQIVQDFVGQNIPTDHIDLKDSIFFPILTDKILSPTFLLKQALNNVFPLGIPSQDVKVHGLSVSPLGQMIHDMTHGFAVADMQILRLKKDCAQILSDLPSDMPFTAQEDFERIMVNFLKQKNMLFRGMLRTIVEQFEEQDNKVGIAGLFYIIHEMGLCAWPLASNVGADYSKLLGAFFNDAIEAINKHYTLPLKTSPKTGELQDDEQTVRLKLEIPEGTAINCSLSPGGTVLSVLSRTGSHKEVNEFITENWLWREADDIRKMSAWAKLPIQEAMPVGEMPEEALRAYIKLTQETVIDFVKRTRDSTETLEDETHEIFQPFTDGIRRARKDCRDQMKEQLGQYDLRELVDKFL